MPLYQRDDFLQRAQIATVYENGQSALILTKVPVIYTTLPSCSNNQYYQLVFPFVLMCSLQQILGTIQTPSLYNLTGNTYTTALQVQHALVSIPVDYIA